MAVVLLFSVCACGANADGYEGYVNKIERKAEKFTVHEGKKIAEYGDLFSYGGGTFTEFIKNMSYAKMKDGTNIRCVELIREFDAEQYKKVAASADKYSFIDGCVVIHGSSPYIEELMP